MALNPKQLKGRIESIRREGRGIFLVNIDSPYLSRRSRPGNFIQVKINSVILRRPFSVHSVRGKTVSILVRLRGRGTRILSCSTFIFFK